ncbi:iron chaperone [Companilactobacillus sp. DQM5]|uniref:iron chaperone n=1 Tax=Companilactobacillus sp. DQM5 TaxID=3463359 RepID=UPI00405A0C5D
MDDFNEYLLTIDNKEHLEKIANVLKWIHKEFPQLKPRIAWNQPMYTDHGTFIIGFSVAKNHFSVSAEKANEKFKNEIKKVAMRVVKNYLEFHLIATLIMSY